LNVEFLTAYTTAMSLISKRIDQAVRFLHSIAKATMVLSSVPIKLIKAARESSVGYDSSVIAYKATIISHH